jgi:hypothetical protein
MVAAYPGLIKSLSYDDYVSLYLNIDRTRKRLSWAVADGMALASGNGQIDFEWFEAITSTEAEANTLAYQVNFARAVREAKESAGW